MATFKAITANRRSVSAQGVAICDFACYHAELRYFHKKNFSLIVAAVIDIIGLSYY